MAPPSIWIVNAYQVAMVAALLPFAAWGEIVGHRRVFPGGIALFTLASLACGLAAGSTLSSPRASRKASAGRR
jgi:DHA2 family multidrug resistance protein-like MFS transporter